MTEPTPEPWYWHWRFEDGIATGTVFAESHIGHAYAVAICPRYQEQEQWEADARLIAAAPTMLAILERLVLEESLGASFIPDLTLSLTRAIIAQATGAELS